MPTTRARWSRHGLGGGRRVLALARTLLTLPLLALLSLSLLALPLVRAFLLSRVLTLPFTGGRLFIFIIRRHGALLRVFLSCR
ncbi:MAG: hypothetical protein ACU0BK_00010 [Shimia sp.]|uniref:hypothetical protein n=1 Tax=Shimia sp. TaxID=1954381 RepID=UPI0040580D52